MNKQFNENSVNKKTLFLYLDTETSGLNSKTCGLIEVAGILEFNREQIYEFELKLNPFSYPKEIEIQEKALAVNNRTIPEIKTFHDQKECFNWFIQLLNYYITTYAANRIFIIGYNIKFDIDFIEEWFKINDQKYAEFFQYKYIDVIQLVMLLSYIGTLDPFNITLKEMCLKFNIDLTNAHTALADIKATRLLFHKLISVLNFSGTLLNDGENNIEVLKNISFWGSDKILNELQINKQDALNKALGG